MGDSRPQAAPDRRYLGMTAVQVGIVAVLALMAILVLCGLVYTIASTTAQLGAASEPTAPSTATVRARPTNPATWTPTPSSTTPTPTSTNTPDSTSTPTPQSADAPTPVPDGRHVESEGGFSYVPPSGWQVVEWPGLEYQIAIGAPIEDFAPNLNFVDEAFSGSLDDYVVATIEILKEVLQARIISQEDFFTDEGERGVKVVTENTQHDAEFYQVFYIFDAGEKKIVATYTRPADQGQENDALVDQSMKTFRIEE